jgi:glutaredoxin
MDHNQVPGGTETRYEPGRLTATPAVNVATGTESPTWRGRSGLGSVLLFLGIGLLALLLLEPGELPLSMPRSWYIDRTLWVAGGLISLGAGWYLLRDPEGGSSGERDAAARRAATRAAEFSVEKLGPAGRRFSRLVLYTRSGCHLCDDAQDLLNQYSAFLPPIEAVDIDGDPELIARFSTCVPVVELDGKVRFRGRVNEVLLRRQIAATLPRDTTRSGDVL